LASEKSEKENEAEQRKPQEKTVIHRMLFGTNSLKEGAA
jgi:hypothetical protein